MAHPAQAYERPHSASQVGRLNVTNRAGCRPSTELLDYLILARYPEGVAGTREDQAQAFTGSPDLKWFLLAQNQSVALPAVPRGLPAERH